MARRLIAIVGPTASGKSALALRLAGESGAEIVSCDSLQVYRGLDIGSAKPTAEQQAVVPHHLIDVVDPDAPFSAADYAWLARVALDGIASRGRIALVVGGTGLYLRALLDGLFEGPSRDEPLRRRLEAMAERFGDARLHRLLGRIDPAAARTIHVRDRVRTVRALEVYWKTGRPISRHHERPTPGLTGWEVFILGLSPDRARLRQMVERRTDQMIERGLLDEVRGLLSHGYHAELRPLRAIGYRQAIAVVAGHAPLADARRDIVTETMRYAKRQMTWFRHQADVVWCPDAETALARAQAWLGGAGR